MDPHPGVDSGVRCSSGALQTKAEGRQVKLLWPVLFISSRLWRKHCLWPFSSAVLFFLTSRQAWRWKVKVPAVKFRPTSGVTDRPVSKRHETPVSEKQPAKLSLLSCFIAVWFYYLLSFHFGLWPIKTSRTVEFCGFISFCATSCILKLNYQPHDAGSTQSSLRPHTVPSDIPRLKIQTCEYMHTWVGVRKSSW